MEAMLAMKHQADEMRQSLDELMKFAESQKSKDSALRDAARQRAAAPTTQPAAAAAPAPRGKLPASPADQQRERGNQLFKAGKWQAARDAYSASIDAAATHLAFANRAMAALKLHDFAAAEADASKAIELEPKYVKAYQRRSAARAETGRLLEAIDDLDAAVALQPEDTALAKERAAMIDRYHAQPGSLPRPTQRQAITIHLPAASTASAAPAKAATKAEATASVSAPALESLSAAAPTATAAESGPSTAAAPSFERPTSGTSPGSPAAPPEATASPTTSQISEERGSLAASPTPSQVPEAAAPAAVPLAPSPASPAGVVAPESPAATPAAQAAFAVSSAVSPGASLLGVLTPDAIAAADTTAATAEAAALPEAAAAAAGKDAPNLQQATNGHASLAAAPGVNEQANEHAPTANGVASHRQQPTLSAAASSVAGRFVPKLLPPQRGVDFERTWRALAGQPERQAQYLAQLNPKGLPSLLKSALTAQLLEGLLPPLLGMVQRPETATCAAELLAALPGVPRFELAAMSLSPARKVALSQHWHTAATALPSGSPVARQLAGAMPFFGL